MKKLVSILLTISIAVAALAQPQNFKRGQGRPDFEKMKAERVAFITSEVGLTSQDAQAFWPIYNKAEEKQQELQKAEKKAYMDLSKALKDGQGNVDALLDAYIKAKQANVNVQLTYAKEYKKAIGAEKTAKFFACDEKFRRQQIGKLGGQHKGGPGFGNAAPGQRGPREGFNGKPGKDFNEGRPEGGKDCANCNGEKNCKDCKKAQDGGKK